MEKDFFVEKYLEGELGGLHRKNLPVLFEEYKDVGFGSLSLDLNKVSDYISSEFGFEPVSSIYVSGPVLQRDYRDFSFPETVELHVFMDERVPSISEKLGEEYVLEECVECFEPVVERSFLDRLLGSYTVGSRRNLRNGKLFTKSLQKSLEKPVTGVKVIGEDVEQVVETKHYSVEWEGLDKLLTGYLE